MSGDYRDAAATSAEDSALTKNADITPAAPKTSSSNNYGANHKASKPPDPDHHQPQQPLQKDLDLDSNPSLTSRESKRTVNSSLSFLNAPSLEEMKRKYAEMKKRLKQSEEKAEKLDLERKNLIKNLGQKESLGSDADGEGGAAGAGMMIGKTKSTMSSVSFATKMRSELDLDGSSGFPSGFFDPSDQEGRESYFNSNAKIRRLEKQRRFLVMLFAFAMMLGLAPLSFFLLQNRLKP
ncbi:unnamed protein product [Amoebophrya sp. A120]|nr:unnamed protein product [Amoebophrya sp. A120]|eukprot:GSA120T00019533001.1